VANVTSVTFDISRYGRHTKTIVFDTPVFETEAVRAAEAFLSVPMDRDYYNSIKDDVFGWSTSKFDNFQMRGDALGDCRFLEAINTVKILNNKRSIQIICGS
jgi:hypothetical protein